MSGTGALVGSEATLAAAAAQAGLSIDAYRNMLDEKKARWAALNKKRYTAKHKFGYVEVQVGTTPTGAHSKQQNGMLFACTPRSITHSHSPTYHVTRAVLCCVAWL